MKYFFDTEFIEGFHKPMFGKKRHFIDLISIGIYAEDGRELHLISNRYNYNDADDWVKKNVLLPLYIQSVHGDERNLMDVNNFNHFVGWSDGIILSKILDFFGCYQDCGGLFFRAPDNIEVYAYYADYDWVLFCSLFGRMIDLPKGFPMYCIDLKQMLDEKIKSMPLTDSFEKDLATAKASKRYPKQANEHNALDDAKWNFELYKYINTKYKPFIASNNTVLPPTT